MVNFLNTLAALICGSAAVLGILHGNVRLSIVGTIFTVLNIMCLVYNL